jgi:hypothetical protein
MNPPPDARINQLIQEHFPWAKPGFPASAPAEPDQKRRFVEDWLRRQTVPFRAAVTTLVARVQPILRDVEEEVGQAGEQRLVARIDLGNVTKSATSILEKMVRAWKEPDEAPPVHFDNFTRKLDDLGRFRIVTNFLSDVERIAERLAAAYHPRQALSDAQRALGEDYRLHEDTFEDKVLLHPRDRNKGERCFKGVFEPRQPERFAIPRPRGQRY